MDAPLDNVKCEASSDMVNLNVRPVMATSPLAGGCLKSMNLEGGYCDANIVNVLQGAALSFHGTAGTAQDEVLPLKVMAGSGVEDFMEPGCSNSGPHVEIPASEDCVKSDSLDSEVSACTETQALKGVPVCAICHEKIKTEETAEIKGCEHAYCVTCILRWATYKTEPWCPQCRLPFSFLYVYKALDGSLSDYLFEESVCLLLRACWFKPLVVEELEEQDDYQDDYDAHEELYYTANVRLGNRRWGDSGYVRTGRREARPVGVRQVGESGSSSSRQAKAKEPPGKEAVGRRARRAQKREQLDKIYRPPLSG